MQDAPPSMLMQPASFAQFPAAWRGSNLARQMSASIFLRGFCTMKGCKVYWGRNNPKRGVSAYCARALGMKQSLWVCQLLRLSFLGWFYKGNQKDSYQFGGSNLNKNEPPICSWQPNGHLSGHPPWRISQTPAWQNG